MEITTQTKSIIIDAISKRASKIGVKTSEVQILLFAESENKVGVVYLKNGVAEVKSSINSILGSVALIPTVSNKVNQSIYKTLEQHSKQLQVSILVLSARLFVVNEQLMVDIYVKNEFEKSISIEDILKQI